MKKGIQMNAIIVNRILLASLALLIIIAGVEIYFFRTTLQNAVIAADHKRIDAEIEQANYEKLENLSKALEKEAKTVERAQRVVSDSQSYQFQNQVVEDVTAYANQAGIGIKSFVFADDSADPRAQAQKKGPKRTDVTVQINGDIPIENYLLFLKYIENNLSKMQVKGVAIAPIETSRTVLDDPVVALEVFIR